MMNIICFSIHQEQLYFSTQFEGCMGVADSKDLTTPVSFASVSHTSGVKKTFLVLEA